jgi:hypothetical protein
MTRIAGAALAATLAMGALSTASAAKPHEDEVCRKYVEYDKFGNRGGTLKPPEFNTFCRETCKDSELLQCDETVAVLRGKSDPAPLHPFFKDFFHYVEIKNNSHCVTTNCGKKDAYEAAIAYGLPGATPLLLDQIDSEEKLKDLHCGDKAAMYRALWYLGDKTAADTMIKGYNNLLCTNDHFNNTVPIIDQWALSEAQLGAIEKVCVDGIFGEKLRNADSSFKACFTFFAKRGKIGEDGMEYIKMNAEKDTFALRALASLDGKGSQAKFTKMLAESAKEEAIKDKKGKPTKKMMTTWRGGREDAIFSALALYLAGDKAGKGAIDHWLSFTKDNELVNRDGFERVFVIGAPFWPEADQAKLRKVLEASYAAGVKAMAKNDKLAESMTRAAFGLAQIGSNKGLDLILAAIDGDDNGRRMEVITAIGGTQNYQGGRYVGAGGLKIGGKAGLAKADVDKISESLLKRAKFLKDRDREVAVRAILDIRGRSKAAGL